MVDKRKNAKTFSFFTIMQDVHTLNSTSHVFCKQIHVLVCQSCFRNSSLSVLITGMVALL